MSPRPRSTGCCARPGCCCTPPLVEGWGLVVTEAAARAHPRRSASTSRAAGLRRGRRDGGAGPRRELVRRGLVHARAVSARAPRGPGPGRRTRAARFRWGHTVRQFRAVAAEAAARRTRSPERLTRPGARTPRIRRSLALFRAFLREQDRPRALLRAARPGRRRPGRAVRRPAARAGGRRRRRRQRLLHRGVPAARRAGLSLRARPAGAGARGTAARGRGGRRRLSAAARRRRRRHLLLLQRAGACRRPADLPQRAGPGHPARRADLRRRSPTGSPPGAATSGRPGTTWAPSGPAPATGAVPGRPPSTPSARTSSPCTSAPPCGRCAPATTCTVVSARSRYWPFLAEAVARVAGRSARSPPGTSSSSSGGVHHDARPLVQAPSPGAPTPAAGRPAAAPRRRATAVAGAGCWRSGPWCSCCFLAPSAGAGDLRDQARRHHRPVAVPRRPRPAVARPGAASAASPTSTSATPSRCCRTTA